jgi:hypothetical protein
MWVRHYGSGLAKSNDKVKATTIDDSGNVYIIGEGGSKEHGIDYYTIKFNPLGVNAWTAKYNGSPFGNDFVSAIHVDKSGNVYVTGKSWSDTSFIYTTVKYDKNGVEQWNAKFSKLNCDDCTPTAITVDKCGNVYLLAKNKNAKKMNATLTVKYNLIGVEQWFSLFNAPDSSNNEPVAITTDDSCNVYVMGIIQATKTSADFAMIKYRSDGTEQWVSYYDSGANRNDVPINITVDSLANIYVIGKSRNEGERYEFVTIKYNSTGEKQWVTRFRGENPTSDYEPAIITYDASGNVYVAGTGGNEIVTIKYNSDGVESFRKTTSKYGTISDMKLDNVGNIYVTGIRKKVVSAENKEVEVFLFKYGIEDGEVWKIPNEFLVSQDPEFEITSSIDKMGNIYITGNTGSYVSHDYVIIKYDKMGKKLWQVYYDGEGSDEDIAEAIAVDDTGNVYIAGTNVNKEVTQDITIIKYNAQGKEQWLNHNQIWKFGKENIIAANFDVLGNLYIAGTSRQSEKDVDYVLMKCDLKGNIKWNARYKGKNNYDDYLAAVSSHDAVSLAVDNTGSAYLAGTIQGNFLTIKYNSEGKKEWEKVYKNGDAFVTAIAVDESGNVYVTGKVQGVKEVGSDYAGNRYFKRAKGYDILTIKYTKSGKREWISRYDSSFEEDDHPSDIATDRFGNIFIVGWTKDYKYDKNLLIIKYDTKGEELWDVEQKENGYDGIITVDLNGNAYVASTLRDIFLSKYDGKNGSIIWTTSYQGVGQTYQYAHDIFVDKTGNIYLTAMSAEFGWRIFTTLKYSQNQNSSRN